MSVVQLVQFRDQLLEKSWHGKELVDSLESNIGHELFRCWRIVLDERKRVGCTKFQASDRRSKSKYVKPRKDSCAYYGPSFTEWAGLVV